MPRRRHARSSGARRASKVPVVTRAFRRTNSPRSPRNRRTTMNTPGVQRLHVAPLNSRCVLHALGVTLLGGVTPPGGSQEPRGGRTERGCCGASAARAVPRVGGRAVPHRSRRVAEAAGAAPPYTSTRRGPRPPRRVCSDVRIYAKRAPSISHPHSVDPASATTTLGQRRRDDGAPLLAQLKSASCLRRRLSVGGATCRSRRATCTRSAPGFRLLRGRVGASAARGRSGSGSCRSSGAAP